MKLFHCTRFNRVGKLGCYGLFKVLTCYKNNKDARFIGSPTLARKHRLQRVKTRRNKSGNFFNINILCSKKTKIQESHYYCKILKKVFVV